MTVGNTYASRATQAVLGPARSTLIPGRLHVGWLDVDGDLIAMSGRSVPQSIFTPVTGGVANVSTIDAGVAGFDWPAIHAIGLYDAASDGALVLSADLTAPVTPVGGATLTVAAGKLVFQVTA
jgi:hypothetical protein